MLILQFIPLPAPTVTARLLRPLRGGDTVAVLDLEDGHWDLADETRTPALKAAARERLLALCALPVERRRTAPVAMRLNAPSSPEFARDLPVARVVAQTLGLRMILLAKVTSGAELRAARAALEAAGVPATDLVPLVETQAGLRELPAILEATRAEGGSGVVFGHYDYSLEARHWPFRSMTEAAFWTVAADFARAVRAAGLRYIHPPPAQLHDVEELRFIVAQVRWLTGDHCGMLAAGITQTPILRHLSLEAFPAAEPPGPQPGPQRDQRERLRLAEETVALFAANQRAQFSFATDGRQGRFIPPHEYMAARHYLQEAGDA